MSESETFSARKKSISAVGIGTIMIIRIMMTLDEMSTSVLKNMLFILSKLSPCAAMLELKYWFYSSVWRRSPEFQLRPYKDLPGCTRLPRRWQTVPAQPVCSLQLVCHNVWQAL